ncbi:MAG: glycosyltransferase family 39 protein [Cyanobacteriota/Melainabacteria group bacterium]
MRSSTTRESLSGTSKSEIGPGSEPGFEPGFETEPGMKPSLAVGVLVLACTLLYFPGLGSFPAVNPAEAYYVEAGREMVELGNYITPYLNYQIYFSKPIMTFWLTAASYKLFGVSEAAARLPFALIASAMVLGVYLFVSRIKSVRAGAFAGLSLAASPLLLLIARESPIDIAFSAFLALAVLATGICLSSPVKESRYSWTLIYIGLGLAVLTKGPAAVALYLMAVALFLVMTRPGLKELGGWLSRLKLLPGIALFLAVILPWHAAVWMQTEGLFLKVFFLYENVARYAGHTNMGKMSVWFFIPVLAAGFFPFVLLLFPAFKNALSLSGKRLREDPVMRGLAFVFAFAAATFTFFSFSGTKLITYILPVMAPIAVFVGIFIDSLCRSAEANKSDDNGSLAIWRKTFSLSVLVYGLVAAAGLVFALFYFSTWNVLVKALAVIGLTLFCVGSVIQFRLFRSGAFVKSVSVAFATMVLALSILANTGFHLFYTHQEGDLMKVSTKAGEISDRVHMFGVFMPSAIYYARGPVNTFFLTKQIKPLTASDAIRRTIIVRDRDLPKLSEVPGLVLEPVEKAGQWGLYRISGFEVEKVMILEDVFRMPEVFQSLMDGDTSMGPLTVPYAAGRAGQNSWSEKQR